MPKASLGRWLSRITALKVRKQPTGMLAVAGNAWLKGVFSRPGPQEPNKGLPGQAGENPKRPLVGERPRARWRWKAPRGKSRSQEGSPSGDWDRGTY